MFTQYLKKQVHKVYGLNLGQRNAVDSCQYMKWKVCLTSYQQQRFYKDRTKSRKKSDFIRCEDSAVVYYFNK